MKSIDVHTHGIGGYDTRTADAEHILKIAELHGSQGVSAIVPAIYPASIEVMRENMAVVREAMDKQKGDNSARIIGVHLEGPFLNPSKCGALNEVTFLEPAEYHLKELIEGFEDMVRIITIAPELEGSLELIEKISALGIIASMGHSDATYSEAEAGFRAGAKGITHLFNAMRGFHHREPGIAGFGLMNRDVYIEVIADPYHLHRKALDLIFRVKDPDRVLLVSDTVKETTPVSRGKGVADKHGKLTGGCMTIAESAERLIAAGFERDVVTRCVTENPEKYLKSATSNK